MRRCLAPALILCFATTALAQSRLNGKWGTPRPEPPLSEDKRRQSVQLELAIEDATASGTLNLGGLGGTLIVLKDGKVNGDKVHFRVDATGTGTWRTWTAQLVDDDTVMLTRSALELAGNNLLDLLKLLGEGPVQPGPGLEAASVAPRSIPVQAGSNGSISGVVTDASRASIPGVTVTATNAETGMKLTTTTNEAGRYDFPNAIPGKYIVNASLPGFNTAAVNDLSIGNKQFQQDLMLLLPSQSAPPVLDPSSCGSRTVEWCAVLRRSK